MMITFFQWLLFAIKLASATENVHAKERLDAYRIAYPHPEDYVIELLVNPCGVNDTNIEIDNTIPLGYNCCMNQFGRGEYGFLKHIPDSHSETGEYTLNHAEVFEKRVPAGPNEVLHNMVIVNEDGVEIPYEYSRRADDHTVIDENCRGLRDPHTTCLGKRLRAFKSPFVSSCWDHNQTVDSTVSCYTPEGYRKPNCMQVSYSQNSFIHICGGDYFNDPNCGSYIEIHRSNGSPYECEATSFSETKIMNSETNGMTTTTIDLTYKGNPNRILCAYNETKIRVGSMVRISEESQQCCCPPSYNKLTKLGSFFCPRKKGVEAGPFVDFFDTLAEQFERDKDHLQYPFCHDMEEDEDVLMCSRDLERNQSLATSGILSDMIGSNNSLFFTEICQTIHRNENNRFSSEDLQGEYEDSCKLGRTFGACGANGNWNECASRDRPFNFRNKIGKVTRLPRNEKEKEYGVTFNDGRTEYNFTIEYLELQEPDSNYELWFVQRNRFEKILQKRKGFRVVWPECTFDPVNDRYYPFAEVSPEGTVVRVLVEKHDDNDLGFSWSEL